MNVTLLFSAAQYAAAASAYMSGIERRLTAGLDPTIGSVASLFVSRWDVAVKDTVPTALRNRLGIAVAQRTYREYRRVLATPRWAALAAAGARPQRLLFASTSVKDPSAADTVYVEALAALGTVNTMPDKTLTAFADHGRVGELLAADGGDADSALARFRAAGVDVDALGAQLQREGAASFDASWKDLLARLAAKQAALAPDAERLVATR